MIYQRPSMHHVRDRDLALMPVADEQAGGFAEDARGFFRGIKVGLACSVPFWIALAVIANGWHL